jgi:hypothetical protein
MKLCDKTLGDVIKEFNKKIALENQWNAYNRWLYRK